MFYLVLHILCIACFSFCYKVARKEGCRTKVVQLVMYAISVLISLPFAIHTEGFSTDWQLIGLGILTGVFLICAIAPFFAAMKQGALAIGWTFVNLAVLIPLAVSIFVWHEIPTGLQLAGIALMIPAVVLFGDLRMNVSGSKTRWLILVLVASVMTGVVQTMNNLVSRLPSGNNGLFTYMTWIFLTGAIGLAFSREARNWKLLSRDSGIGIIMGVFNFLCLWTFLKSLEYLPGTVFFPVKSACGVILTAVFAVLIWKEKLAPRQWAAIVLAALSVVLIKTGPG